jgi:hypothetical protein
MSVLRFIYIFFPFTTYFGSCVVVKPNNFVDVFNYDRIQGGILSRVIDDPTGA